MKRTAKSALAERARGLVAEVRRNIEGRGDRDAGRMRLSAALGSGLVQAMLAERLRELDSRAP